MAPDRVHIILNRQGAEVADRGVEAVPFGLRCSSWRLLDLSIALRTARSEKAARHWRERPEWPEGLLAHGDNLWPAEQTHETPGKSVMR